MSRVDAAAADRLPWLSDEPKSGPARRPGTLLPWAAATMLVVAVGAFWLGVQSMRDESTRTTSQGHTSTTVRLPATHTIQPQVAIVPQPEVKAVAAPEVRPAPVREVRLAAPRAVKPAQHQVAVSKAPTELKSAAEASPGAPVVQAPQFALPRPWNPRVFAGASGRVVQVGAFGTIHQAKEGWWFMVRAYPAVAHLPAVVRTSRNSKGRAFYRFQVGTTSQAHSEVLCQRMQKIGLSCAVVGLPWKAKVER